MSAPAPRLSSRRQISGRSASVVLRGRGLVVDAACIDISAVIQQHVGDGNRRRLVERLLPVASARVHERGLRGQHLSKLVDPAKSCSHVRCQLHAAREEKPHRFFGGVVQDGVRSVLPFALEVEVCTGGDQHLEHVRLFPGDVRGTLAEREHRRVDVFLDVRQSEEPPDCGDFTVRHRISERLDVALPQMLDEHRPRVEAGFARDGELRVRELRRARGAGVRANRLQASKSGGIAGPGVAKQIFSELVLLFEIGGNARILDWTWTTSFKTARVRIVG